MYVDPFNALFNERMLCIEFPGREEFRSAQCSTCIALVFALRNNRVEWNVFEFGQGCNRAKHIFNRFVRQQAAVIGRFAT